MPRKPLILMLTLILSCTLAGCSLSVPSADTLMTVFFEPFLCGFSFSDASSAPLAASLVRTAEGDLLTVYGEYGNTVFSHDGTAPVIRTNGSETLAPLSLPLPPQWNTGSAAMLALFSVPPDDSFSVTRTDDGFFVTNDDGSYTAVFASDRTPVRITHGSYCAEVTSFSENPHAGT